MSPKETAQLKVILDLGAKLMLEGRASEFINVINSMPLSSPVKAAIIEGATELYRAKAGLLFEANASEEIEQGERLWRLAEQDEN